MNTVLIKRSKIALAALPEMLRIYGIDYVTGVEKAFVIADEFLRQEAEHQQAQPPILIKRPPSPPPAKPGPW